MSALHLRCGIAWSTRRVHGPTRGRTVIDAFQSARAFVALGSNLGNRAANMEAAVERLRKLPHTHVVATSHVYETLPRINDETNHVQDAVHHEGVDLTSPAAAADMPDFAQQSPAEHFE